MQHATYSTCPLGLSLRRQLGWMNDDNLRVNVSTHWICNLCTSNLKSRFFLPINHQGGFEKLIKRDDIKKMLTKIFKKKIIGLRYSWSRNEAIKQGLFFLGPLSSFLSLWYNKVVCYCRHDLTLWLHPLSYLIFLLHKQIRWDFNSPPLSAM